MTSDDPLLRSDEAAGILNVKPTTLERWRMTGGGPPYLKLGKVVRYRRSDLEAFAAASTRKSTSEQAAA